ncbi:MAG: pentapeptide repeat-containing protein, partial [Trichodesmium sp. St15_bin1_1]|nr:pentapeptide repeat-containing protein [Trichodesmium sp. St15_bin1_1]MDE5117775.1 pentapeptide repeat-containing protein [Trichodesmium sp. St2_bin2_1]
MAKIKFKILIINLLVSLAFAKPVVAYIKWQAQTLKRSRECFYCDLSNINLSNSNYKKMDVTGSVLKSADFSNTNLEEANFTNTDLTEAEFDSANLQEAN